MRIGIITQPLHSNYGGLLQNYALQQVLLRMGHEPITIDQKNVPPPLYIVLGSAIKTLLLKSVGKGKLRKLPLSKRQNECILCNIKSFVDNYIRHTPKVEGYKEIKTMAENLLLDAFIVGSDQVWRPCYNRHLYHSFLDFAISWKVKKVAYAASFGVDSWEYTVRQTQKCKELIQLFDAVSVREKSGIALCSDYFNREACQMLDPTMLLSAEDYIKLVEQESEPPSKGNLLIYILDNELNKTDLVAKIAEELGLMPFSVKDGGWKKRLDKMEMLTHPSVTSWLRGFMDAEFVICDSFHGSVFSIIFNKPFIVIPNKNRGNTRFDSLLQLFGLESRFIEGNDWSVVFEPIDWGKVNQRKRVLQQDALAFLSSTLQEDN